MFLRSWYHSKLAGVKHNFLPLDTKYTMLFGRFCDCCNVRVLLCSDFGIALSHLMAMRVRPMPDSGYEDCKSASSYHVV
jgi:hypothetical protein